MSDKPYLLLHGDCLEQMRAIRDASVDAVVTDPPYPEIDRPYGRMTEPEWHAMMRALVAEIRRVLTPTGSAMFVLQPNSERVGRMRPWLWEFMAWTARDWNQVQDVWWWNIAAPPTVHCQRTRGLMRPSAKSVVWLGAPDCYRNQSAILIEPSDATKALDLEDKVLRRRPSGHSMRKGRIGATVFDRGGATPFNVFPIANTNSRDSAGSAGHAAGTPGPLCSRLVKYITPPGGVVLDPFMGSGSTGCAAVQEGARFVGIERGAEYLDIARARIAYWYEKSEKPPTDPVQTDLFAEAP